MTVETGLSYFHKMKLTVMKVFYKTKKNIVTYQNYKHFSNEAFMLEVKNSNIQMTSRTTILGSIDLRQLLMKLFKDMLL